VHARNRTQEASGAWTGIATGNVTGIVTGIATGRATGRRLADACQSYWQATGKRLASDWQATGKRLAEQSDWQATAKRLAQRLANSWFIPDRVASAPSGALVFGHNLLYLASQFGKHQEAKTNIFISRLIHAGRLQGDAYHPVALRRTAHLQTIIIIIVIIITLI
jgi:hypothetical protein